VAGLIKGNGLAIDPDVATDLVNGYRGCSSNFGGPDVTPENFLKLLLIYLETGASVYKVKLSLRIFLPAQFPQNHLVHHRKFPKCLLRRLTNLESQPEKPSTEAGVETPDINPPSDWLQPKIFKGTSVN